MKGPGKRDEGGREVGDSEADHREQGEEEVNGCGREQCGLGKTGDGKEHQTGGQSEHGEDEKKDGGQEETGKHKDWGRAAAGAKDTSGETATAKMAINGSLHFILSELWYFIFHVSLLLSSLRCSFLFPSYDGLALLLRVVLQH